MNKIWLIAQREFSVRVKKKTFLLTTILLPLMIFGFYALMIYFSVKPGEQYNIAIADPAGILGPELPAKSDQISFQKVEADSAQLEALIQSGAYSAYLQIPSNYQSDSRDTLALRSTKSIGLISREQIKSRLEKALREQRFLSLQISKARLDSLQMESPIIFQTSSGGKTSENRAGISYAVGFGSGFLIYI
ncbi:MAG TPA: ABC transporter permease, partial [Chitinophagaceae bacterium]|nr:ABC transporter permease [Chitinophagaceae bacterium]